MLRTISKYLLILNGVMLAFVALGCLGGANRGYFGGGAATEVDGIMLLFLTLFNVSFLLAAYYVLSQSAKGGPLPPEAAEVLNKPPAEAATAIYTLVRKWAGWGLAINGVLLVFVGLWLLLMNDERRGYFQSNAASVDMVVLLVLSALNIGHMGLMRLLPFPVQVKGS